MTRNFQRRCAVERIVLILRLLLVAAILFCGQYTLTRRYGCERSNEGSTVFAFAFCDKNLAARSRKPFRPDSKVVREIPKPRFPTKKAPFANKISRLEMAPSSLPLSGGSEESLLLFWVFAFSFSHIGMSAIRQTLITDVFGKFIANDLLGVVGTGKFRLPDFWPGDSSGTNELFPDIETTGRQFYRIFYTLVSFLTLGKSFSIYLDLRHSSDGNMLPTAHDIVIHFTDTLRGSGDGGAEFAILLSYAIATLSSAFSLSSGVNASPLGLVPSFRQKEEHENTQSSDDSVSNTGRTVSTPTAAGDTLLGITRDDGLKFDPKGLTRITRHPLILPVFPWGIATSVLAGGQPSDVILFCGLSVYSIAGCYCQDLRVLREEGSVGTVFFVSNKGSDTADQTKTKINEKLKSFYNETSFIPFQALIDGRQSWVAMAKEFPIFPFLIAIPSAFAIETVLLRFLGVEYSIML